MNKKVFFAAATFIALIIGYVVYANFLKTAPAMSKLKAEYSVSAVDLYTEYDSNEETANQKYQNRVIEITGEIMLVIKDEGFNPIINLKTEGFGVVKCTLETQMTTEELNKVRTNTSLTLRGECIGMLLDVLIEKAIIL
jgi:hypothetical protein